MIVIAFCTATAMIHTSNVNRQTCSQTTTTVCHARKQNHASRFSMTARDVFHVLPLRSLSVPKWFDHFVGVSYPDEKRLEWAIRVEACN